MKARWVAVCQLLGCCFVSLSWQWRGRPRAGTILPGSLSFLSSNQEFFEDLYCTAEPQRRLAEIQLPSLKVVEFRCTRLELLSQSAEPILHILQAWTIRHSLAPQFAVMPPTPRRTLHLSVFAVKGNLDLGYFPPQNSEPWPGAPGYPSLIAVVRCRVAMKSLSGATGGELILEMPWMVEDDRLAPIAYRYRTDL